MQGFILTESGIITNDGIESSEIIVSHAKRAMQLYQEGGKRGFFDYIMKVEGSKELTEYDRGTLYCTIIDEEFRITIGDHMSYLDEIVDDYYDDIEIDISDEQG
jgi:hypothetical protein